MSECSILHYFIGYPNLIARIGYHIIRQMGSVCQYEKQEDLQDYSLVNPQGDTQPAECCVSFSTLPACEW